MRLNRSRLLRPAPSAARRPGFRPRCEALEERWVPTTLPPGFQEVDVALGLASPTSVAVVPDGSGRVFITLQGGQMRVWDPNAGLLPTPFLSVTTTATGERGLQSVAFDPDYVNNGYVYVYYTVPATAGGPYNRVTRWTTNPANPNVALAGSEQRIIRLPNLSTATNHNGGGLAFIWDGTLVITTGENANPPLSQNLNNLLGKVLRIDVTGDDFPADADQNYSVPADNPFVGQPNRRGEIFSYGFRNPFQMAVHPYTAKTYVNDVGQSGATRREEIDDLFIETTTQGYGGNYGWPMREGYTTEPQFVSPVFAYGPGYGGTNCSIVGGDFYAVYPGFEPYYPFPADFHNDYFFADFCGNWIHRYDPETGETTPFATSTRGSLVDVAMDGNLGFLYYVARSGGALTLVWYEVGAAPGAPGDGVLIGALNGAAPVALQVAPQTLAERPAARTVDQLFAGRSAEEAEPVAVDRPDAPAADNDLWSPIF